MGLRQVEEHAKSWSETARSEGQTPAMREVAEQAIKKLDKKDIPAIYLQVLKSDSSKKVSRMVLYQLGYYAERGDERALATLKQTALDVKQDRELREAALMGLRGSKQPEQLYVFSEIAKKDPDSRLRQFALYQIGRVESANEEAAYKLLSEYALDKSESRGIREAALSSLRSIRGSKAVSLYLDVAKNDPDEQIQQMALYFFVDASKGEPDQTFAAIKEILLDRKRPWSIRESAMSLLPRMDNDQALGLLVSVAKNEPEERIRMSAINYISQVGKNKSKSLQTLISLFETLPKDQPSTVQSLLYGIASVGNDEAVDFLGKVAKTHENLNVRRTAVQFLGNVGGDKARGILVEILQGK
jgi:HEAT repeat protein